MSTPADDDAPTQVEFEHRPEFDMLNPDDDDKCEACDGTGGRVAKCPVCDGSGRDLDRTDLDPGCADAAADLYRELGGGG